MERLQGDIAAMLVKMQTEADKGATSLQGQIGILVRRLSSSSSLLFDGSYFLSEMYDPESQITFPLSPSSFSG